MPSFLNPAWGEDPWHPINMDSPTPRRTEGTNPRGQMKVTFTMRGLQMLDGLFMGRVRYTSVKYRRPSYI